MSKIAKQEIVRVLKDHYIKNFWIFCVFINLCSQAISLSLSFYQENLSVLQSKDITVHELYFDIFTNTFTVFAAILFVYTRTFSFVDTLRITSIFLLEIYDTILIYASKYYEFGLLSGGHLEHSYRNSLYFSIITWTTVGFGDVTPADNLKYFVSSEALLGQIIQSVSIGAVVALTNPWISSLKAVEDVSQQYVERVDTARRAYKHVTSKTWRKMAFARSIRARRKRLGS